MSGKRWVSKIVGYGLEDPEQLLANPLNPRRHDRHQQEVMVAMLREVGFVQDVIVNQTTGNLIDGHLRVQLALRAGANTIPVKYVALDPETERAAIATLDAITGLAETSEEAFDELLQSVATGEAELQGFLSTLYESGGSLPDDTAAGDDMTPSRPLGKMVWGGHTAVMSTEEKTAIFDRLDAYETDHGSANGFVAALLAAKEQ